jgi:hypothetical protein
MSAADQCSSQPAASQDQDPAATCIQCAKSIGTKCTTAIMCAGCRSACHIGCLINTFTASNGGSLKTSHQWLADFLRAGNFHYICANCIGQGLKPTLDFPALLQQVSNASSVVDSSNQPSNILHSMSTQVSDLSAKMVVITQQISSLQSSMSTVFTSISASNTSDTNDTATSSGVRNSSIMSYSQAVTKDISDMVKSAVTTSLQEQKSAERKEERDKATVVLYNAKENGQDPADVRALLSKLQCDIGFSSCYRLGRSPPSGSPSSRPLKVILLSASDRDYLLETCDYARNVLRSSGIRIMPWLQPSEMVRVKEMRQRCVELNDKSQCLANGKKPYVVISGRIRIRGSDGKLHVVKDSVSSDSGKITQPMQHQPHLQFRTSTSFAPSQPKNT